MNDAAVCAYSCVFSNRFFGSSERWLVQECHQNPSPVEQHGDGIPPQAAINPTWKDTFIFCGLYSISGTMQGKVVIFFQHASLL